MKIKYKLEIFLNVLKLAFISLVPFYVLFSTVLLTLELFTIYEIKYYFIDRHSLWRLADFLNQIFPILINGSIAYHLSCLYYKTIDRFITSILSIIIFLSVGVLKGLPGTDFINLDISIFFAIIVPIVTCFVLSFFISKNSYFDKIKKNLSLNIASTLIFIIPTVITYFLLTFIFFYLDDLLKINNLEIIKDGSSFILLLIKTFFSNLLWLIGIHGPNFFDSLVNINQLQENFQVNLKYMDIFNYFVVIGGSGAGLSLVLAIFVATKDKHIKAIGKISFPFVIFNINEVLIFGIPIFMNFTLIIPFILVPIINLLITYFVLSYTNLILFYDIFVPWTTPAILNVFLVTKGNLFAVLLQLSLIILGVLIYIPFIKRYSESQSSTGSLKKISNKFDFVLNVESEADVKFQEAQSSIIKAHYKINNVIELINQNNLEVHYQPKINIKDNICNEFEALLRIRDSNGNIKGPSFINDIEDSGFAHILDIWVCKEVEKDLIAWKEKNLNIEVSINIFPETFEKRLYVKEIISILKGHNISLEIIERRSALTDNIKSNLKLLKENGFKLSLDDLGVGYTNFMILYRFDFDSVKIDRDIIGIIQDEKGKKLYSNICKMCDDLGYEIILEGVEKKEELDDLINPSISKIQGWYFSKAIPFDSVESYLRSFKV